MSEERCGNCKFWLGDRDRSGECRRNPPPVLNDDGEFQFPEMSIDDWCGEWRSKAAASGKLYQLPNGQWITPSMVSAVSAHTDPRGSCVFVCFGVDGGSHEIDCPTKESADSMRNKIAADVNAMVGGAA